MLGPTQAQGHPPHLHGGHSVQVSDGSAALGSTLMKETKPGSCEVLTEPERLTFLQSAMTR